MGARRPLIAEAADRADRAMRLTLASDLARTLPEIFGAWRDVYATVMVAKEASLLSRAIECGVGFGDRPDYLLRIVDGYLERGDALPGAA